MLIYNINPPTPPEWWDPRPATVRYHRPGWRIFVFLLVVVCGSVLIWTGRDLDTVLMTLGGIGVTGAVLARSVADGYRVPQPSLSRPTQPGGAG